jgi:FkbM family methyltransferase
MEFGEKKNLSICLNMIVKDEAHIIKNTLEMLCSKIQFTYWVICDTGSTDDTPSIITDFFKGKKIPGELYHHEWKNFAHNRTLALDAAFGKTDLLFIFDADDEIHGELKMPTSVDSDAYLINFGSQAGVSYQRVLLINNKIKWNFQSVIHEFINCLKPNPRQKTIDGDYYVVSGRSGSRNKDPNKYIKDAKILEEAYYEAKQTGDNLYLRYGFYCANSYKDAGKHEEAIRWYKTVLENDNWAQEKYMSCFYLYNLYSGSGEKEKGFYYLVESFKYDVERQECIYPLVEHYSTTGLPLVAYQYYTNIQNYYETQYLSSIIEGKLFIDPEKGQMLLPYHMILVCDKIKDIYPEAKKTIKKMFEIIFTKKYRFVPDFYIGNALFNLQFFVDFTFDMDKDFVNLFQSYINFLESIKHPLQNYSDFLKKYEKYGIKINSIKSITNKFDVSECKKSNKILFYTGYCNILWNYTYSINNALGGSETAVAQLAYSFPKNYDIYVAGSVKEEKIDNVNYINFDTLKKMMDVTPFHTVIVSRYIAFYEMFENISFYQSFIWAHDIALFNYGCDTDVKSILNKWYNKINGCICQTEWHMNLFNDMYPELKNKLSHINNGITIANFTYKHKRISNRFIYTSCAERGLDRLLEIWPKIEEQFSDAELIICSYNEFPKNDNERKLAAIINKHDNISHIGSLNRDDLYKLMATAEYWLYPTNFPETSCITSMEMLMSEVICIYYPVAGLVNTLGDYGIAVSRDNEVNTLLNLTTKQKNDIRKRGKEYAVSCSWANRANNWCNMLFQNDTIEIIENKENNIIKVINLKKRVDRKSSMIEQFKKENITNYEFIEAVDGNELTETEELRLLFEGNNFNYRKGIIGCALSHIKIWNNLINDDNNEYYVVLEDDLELFKNFKEKLKEHCKIFEEQKLEHLSLGVFECNYLDQDKIKTNEIKIFQKDVYKFWNVAFAYIVSKQAAQKMINFINKCSVKCAIDNPQSYGEVIKYHHTTCCVVRQKNVQEVGTDIQHDYNNLKFTKNIQSNLRIAYIDWWYEEYCGGSFDFNNNFIIDILRKYGNIGNIMIVNPTQNPDVLLYSIFGYEHLKYPNLRRVFFSGEPFGIRSEADFNFTFDRTSDKNIRYPLWLGYLNDYLLEECQRRRNGIINVPKREHFCSFIANGEVKTTHRRTIVEKLSAYKKVHCGGKYLNNIGYNVPRGVNCSGKIEHNNQYKFAIAFENEDYPGYVTEKICDIYKSNCIPIYWGTTDVVNDFNPKTFINARDFSNFDELVEYIIKVDNDDELYASYFKEPFFSNKWLDTFNDPNNTFYKNLADCIIGKHKKLYDNYYGTPMVTSDFKIGFYDNGLSERGTTTALYSYAHYAEEYFDCQSIIFYNKNHYSNNINVIEKFNNRFTVYDINDFEEIDKLILKNNIKYFYNTCGGKQNSTQLVKNCKNLIHAVFEVEPFGDKYAAISQYLSNKSTLYKNVDFISYMVDLPGHSDNMRKELNLPENAYVIGRYGGFEQFDIQYVHQAIKLILSNEKCELYFVFVNTRVFYNHPRIIYLGKIIDPYLKTKYINTCDCMIHARSDGETFGLAIAEFSTLNKPIITCKSDIDNCHLDILGEKAIIFNSKESLINILNNIKDITNSRLDWNAYKEFTPYNVMKKFRDVFLPKELFLGKYKLCFDIGANIGEWSLKNIDKYDQIIAVEASEKTFNRLIKHINNNQKIIPLNYAVCDSKEEYIKFYNCETDVLSTTNNKWLNGGMSRFNLKYEETLCKTISIDKLIEIYGIPDLIKIDVETAEYECIKSMSKKCNTICFEWASEFVDNTFNCLNYLYKLGYRHFYVQMNNDDYTFTPNEYYTIEQSKQLLLKTTPRNEWGMVWCK